MFGYVGGQEFSFKTQYVFKVKEDGSANFITKYRVPLESEEKEKDFEDFMANFSENKERELSIFINDTEPIVEQASKETNRDMVAKDFNVSVEKVETITGTFGLIEYNFIWTNFAETSENEIIIGDVFVGGLKLGKNDTLKIMAPNNSAIENVEPQADEEKDEEASWKGPIEFDSGEPSVGFSLKNESSNQTSPGEKKENNYLIWFSLGGITFFVVLLAYTFYNKNKKKQESEKVEEVRGDKELILELIKENNGEMFQNKIVKETDFSKSKVSNLLNDLKEKEKIKKIKKGRKNLIRIN